MKTKLFLFVALSMTCLSVLGAGKPRLVVLTDIGGDPDDQMPMVRLMTYANQIDIEGLVAKESSGRVNPEQIQKIIAAHGKIRDNLEQNEPGFPIEKYTFRNEFQRPFPLAAWVAWARAKIHRDPSC